MEGYRNSISEVPEKFQDCIAKGGFVSSIASYAGGRRVVGGTGTVKLFDVNTSGEDRRHRGRIGKERSFSEVFISHTFSYHS